MLITSISKDEGAPTLAGTCVTILSSNIVVDAITNSISSQRREGPSRHRVSALSTMLRLYVRQPGEWFYCTKQTQHINYQMIAIDITHRNSCQVVCFFIGPGRCVLLQYLDIQADNSFVTRQVVWKFRNVASEHINIVKRRKTLWERKRKNGHTQGFPLPQSRSIRDCPIKTKKNHYSGFYCKSLS